MISMISMAKLSLLLHFCLLLLVAFVFYCHCQEKEVYVVLMGDQPKENVTVLESLYHSMLESILRSTSLAKESLIYSYGRSFNGFAAKLSKEEADRISGMEGVISVFPNRAFKLHTTRSWDFMGLTARSSGACHCQEGDVIIGFLDTGIWPEADSFNDKGLSHVPRKWRGRCHAANFTCNNKIIGARYYNSIFNQQRTYESPRDSHGHGTHSASTAAGREVHKASFLGQAKGLARGGVPGARIAVYKVCGFFGCFSADILKAFDDAIFDGVDIISVSFGWEKQLPYLEDPIAMGSLYAMMNGILTTTSAGNAGPYLATISNSAPWQLTVAAGTIDRHFSTRLVLGNGHAFTGLSINTFELDCESYPLVWAGDAANYSAGATAELSRYCLDGTINSYQVEGKIVLCDYIADDSAIMTANAVGMILAISYDGLEFAESYPLPTTVIDREDRQKVLNYIKTTENPIVTILVSETWKDAMAPNVASFSSRGPNPITPRVLKPDFTAPGVEILAAWPPISPPSLSSMDTRSVKYNIMTGTSIACSHATGAAAYVKAAHPHWSPTAIKSALMTTASLMDPRKNSDLEFAYGSGYLNPTAAVNPGLVFDAQPWDYVNFLSNLGYNTSLLQPTSADGNTKHMVFDRAELRQGWDFNYPSFALSIEDGNPINGFFVRTATNVGFPYSTYTAFIETPDSVNVVVEPSILSFSFVGEEKTFVVFVEGPEISQQPIMSGAIVWDDGVHQVRTPLVIYTVLAEHSFGFSFKSIAKKASMI